MFLPNQNIPESEKDTVWCIQNLEAIDRMTSTSDWYYSNKQRYANIYNGNVSYDEDERFKYLTNFLNAKVQRADGTEDELRLPAKLRHVPIIRPRIDRLVGEEAERPIMFSVIAMSEDILRQKENDKVKAYSDFILNEIVDIASEISYLGRQLKEQGEQQAAINYSINAQIKAKQSELDAKLDEFDQWYNVDDKHLCEMQAEHLLNYLIYALKLKEKFLENYVNIIVYGEQSIKVEVRNEGELPTFRVVNQLGISYPYSTNDNDIANAPWVREVVMMTYPEIIDNFSSYLTQEQVDLLSNLVQNYVPTMGYNVFLSMPGYSVYSTGAIRVMFGEWKSTREVMIRKTTTPDGKFTFHKIIENEEDIHRDPKLREKIIAREKKSGMIEMRYIEEVWEGVKIHTNIYCRLRKRPWQLRYLDKPSYTPLSYTGNMYSSINSLPLSLIGQCEELQILYDIVNYHRELLLATSGVKGIVYDISQVPDGMTMEQVLYYIKLGFAPINGAQNDVNGIPGMGGGSKFNQFQNFDLTLPAHTVDSLNLLMQSIKAQVTEITGVTDQSLGDIQTKALVGTTEQSILQSSLNTAPRLNAHYVGTRRALDLLLAVAKYTMKDCKIMYQYVLSEPELNVRFELDGQLLNNSDYGVFLSNVSKDIESLTELKQMANSAVSAGILSFDEVINLFRGGSNINTISRRFEYLAKKKARMIKEQQSEQNRIAQEQAQLQAQGKQQELQANMQIEQLKISTQKELHTAEMQFKVQELQLRLQEIADKRADRENATNLEKMKIDGQLRLKDKEIENSNKQAQDKFAFEVAKLNMSERLEEKKFSLSSALEQIKSDIKRNEADNKVELSRLQAEHKIQTDAIVTENKITSERQSNQMELDKLQAEIDKLIDEIQLSKVEGLMELSFMKDKNELELQMLEDKRKQKEKEAKMMLKIKATAPKPVAVKK